MVLHSSVKGNYKNVIELKVEHCLIAQKKKSESGTTRLP